MKNLTRVSLAAVSIIGSAFVARAQVPQLDVGVRAELADKPFGKTNLKEAPEHGKIYGILAVVEVKGRYRLIKPVNAQLLKDEVCHELDLHGFHQVAKGQKPEILITVQYARSGLINPFFSKYEQTYSSGMSADGGEGRMRTISGTAESLFREREPGMKAKMDKAEQEKLAIKIIAWEYPTDPKSKPKQLWNVLMNVDDPDNLDLNAIAAQMLAAGAPYFDKEIKEEIEISRPLPEGHVKVGTPEVVGADVQKTK